MRSRTNNKKKDSRRSGGKRWPGKTGQRSR